APCSCARYRIPIRIAWSLFDPATSDTGLASPLDLAEWQARTTSFEAIAGYRWRTVDLTGGISSERLHGLWVTPEFFNVFGITGLNGRTLPARAGARTRSS